MAVYKLVLLFILCVWGFCLAQLDVTPGTIIIVENDTIRVPVVLTNPDNVEIDAFGAKFLYSSDLLIFSKVVNKGTLTEEWIQVSGQTTRDGVVTIGGFNLSPETGSGILLYVDFTIFTDNHGTAMLALTDFVDDIATAQTTPVTAVIALPPQADFRASTQYGDLPLSVQFENLSTGTITDYLWDFGEGGKSTDRDPLYHYTDIGPFTVTLIVSGPAGSDTTSKVNFIQAFVKDGAGCVPHSFELYQNYPNPFNPGTKITFAVAERGHVSVRVYNARGRHISTLQNGVLGPGRYSRYWNGTGDGGEAVPSGVYFCRADTGNQTKVVKMVLLQ